MDVNIRQFISADKYNEVQAENARLQSKLAAQGEALKVAREEVERLRSVLRRNDDNLEIRMSLRDYHVRHVFTAEQVDSGKANLSIGDVCTGMFKQLRAAIAKIDALGKEES